MFLQYVRLDEVAVQKFCFVVLLLSQQTSFKGPVCTVEQGDAAIPEGCCASTINQHHRTPLYGPLHSVGANVCDTVAI